MKKITKLSSLGIVAATLVACATSAPRFSSETNTPDLGGMPGSEAPITPAYIPGSQQVTYFEGAGLSEPDYDAERQRVVSQNEEMDQTNWNSPSRHVVTGASSERKMEKRKTHAMPLVNKRETFWQKELVLNQLHHLNQREIAMAKMAKEKSENPQVISLADKILVDHERLEERVSAVAQEEKVTLHTYQTATYEEAFADRLASLEGKDFDQTFLSSMQMGHTMALRDLKRQEAMEGNPKVAGLIREAIPSLKQHERMTSGASRMP